MAQAPVCCSLSSHSATVMHGQPVALALQALHEGRCRELAAKTRAFAARRPITVSCQGAGQRRQPQAEAAWVVELQRHAMEQARRVGADLPHQAQCFAFIGADQQVLAVVDHVAVDVTLQARPPGWREASKTVTCLPATSSWRRPGPPASADDGDASSAAKILAFRTQVLTIATACTSGVSEVRWVSTCSRRDGISSKQGAIDRCHHQPQCLAAPVAFASSAKACA